MATRRTPLPVPRDTLSARIETLGLPQAKGYADFIRTGDPDGPIPCWGALAERFQQDFAKSDDRKALWNVLVEAEDRRPLLLFLDANKDRPDVMAQVLADAHRLPPVLQRALVSLDEVADLVPDHLDALDPAARQLFEAGPDARKREKEQVEVRIATLTAFRYFVPDKTDPANEPGAMKSTAAKSTAVNLATEAATLGTPALAEVAVTAPTLPDPTEGGG